jgi:hypothetical protein
MREASVINQITLREKLEVGNLTIDEVCALKPCSRSGFYAHVKAGLVKIRKHGRKSVVPGPEAKRYIGAGDDHPAASEKLSAAVEVGAA